jgi:Right handed beta helix region
MRSPRLLLILLGFAGACSDDKVASGDAKALAPQWSSQVATEGPSAERAAPTAGRTQFSLKPRLPAPLPPSNGPAHYVSPLGSDTNPGTLEAPWRSIQKAMDALRPGEKAYVAAATYETGSAFGTSADTYAWYTTCSQLAPCSILAYPGEKPVLHGQVRISGSYLRLSGFIIEGPLSLDVTSPHQRRANQMLLEGASYVELSFNEIRKSDYHAGIKVNQSEHVHILNNYIHDNGRFAITYDPRTGNEVAETDHGIYWGSSSGGGNLIANNIIAHNRGKGVQLYPNGTYDVIVSENTIVDNGNAGIIINGKTDRITVVGNIAAFNGKKQIRVQAGDSNRVERNLTYSPSPSLADIENTTLSTVTGNVVSDPLFVNRRAGDYRLTSGSPAIGLGLAEYAPGTDYTRRTRPHRAAPAAGAFEY